jgi:hypothetical protein
MNPCTHKASSLADIAIAECKQYLPLLGCLGIVSLSLFVVSGLNI